MQNYLLTISYDGTSFDGWQKQPGRNTIQGRLESVATELNGGAHVDVNGAGRTDAGVHALAQTATMALDNAVDPTELISYFNKYLPETIAVDDAKEVDARFHARLNAKRKTYLYRIWLGEKAPVFERKYVYSYGKKVNINVIRELAAKLTGTHDFASFVTKVPKKKSCVRTITDVNVREKGDLLEIRFTGDGFMYNQIRIMVGTILEISEIRKNEAIEKLDEIMAAKDRGKAGFTAPPQGLFLEKVEY